MPAAIRSLILSRVVESYKAFLVISFFLVKHSPLKVGENSVLRGDNLYPLKSIMVSKSSPNFF